MVKEKFGEDAWKEILIKSDVNLEFFISSEAYDDSITYQLAFAAAEVTGLPLSNVLSSLGEWWILRTSKEKYGQLLESGGDDLKEFLVNLPSFHNRIMLLYTKLTPPEFQISDVGESSIKVHYFSKREGFKDFVHGLLIGLGKLYKTKVEIELLKSREKGDPNEVFRVTWENGEPKNNI